jgi:REP element-mobilizing transposase RayT
VSTHIYKRHNKSLLLYHLVFPAKCRRKVLSEEVEYSLKKTCEEIAERFEIQFVEIGADEDHVHFLLQTVPTMKPSEMVKKIKSITARELFRLHPEVRNILWGGQFWTSGYYINTVGQYANAKVIQQYVKDQGKTYKQIHREQLRLL